MATYQGEAFIAEQLESLARQTRPPVELVVSDDGSTDRTLEEVAAFARRAPFPVRVHRNERSLGFADNFLKAAGQCTGELIAFCDQDDVWLPGKLECCERELRRPGIQMVIHAGLVVDRELRRTGARFPDVRRSYVAAPLRLDPFEPTYGFAMVFRACLLSALDPASRPASRDLDGHPKDHDEWMSFVASIMGRTAFLAEPLVLYRQHTSQFVGAPDRRVGSVVARSLAVDHGVFTRRAELVYGWRDYLAELAVRTDDDGKRSRLSDAAEFFDAFGRNLERRASLHDSAVPVRRRATSLLRLVAERGYRSRREGGLGSKALLRDVAGLARRHQHG